MGKKTPGFTTTHNKEYQALCNAIHRCHNPKNISYKRYGARGIEVHPDWRSIKTGFPLFLAHIGPCPDPDYSLDRIDNDRGYEPGNVRWTDRHTQQNNTRKKSHNITDYGWGIGLSKHATRRGGPPSALIPYDGRIQCLTDWAKELGIKAPTIRTRLERGLSPADALCPVSMQGKANTKRVVYTHNGVTQSLSQWGKALGMSGTALRDRLNRGWTVEQTLTTPKHQNRDIIVEALDEPNDPLRAQIDECVAILTKVSAELGSRLQ